MSGQDLGFTALDYAVDKFHDPTYDFVAAAPRHIKHAPQQVKKLPQRVRSVPRLVKKHLPGHHHNDMSNQSRGYDDGDDGYVSDEPHFEGLVKGRPGFPPGDGFLPGDQPFAPPKSSARSGRGVDEERYESTRGPRSSTTARDGYQRDSVSDAYEERNYRNRGYGDKGYGYGGGRGYERTPERQAIGYGSYDRKSRSRGNVDDEDDDDDEYYEKRRSSKRSRSRGSNAVDKAKNKIKEQFGSNEEEDGAGNDATKKWAATLAGAAAGGFAGHKAKKDNWVPAAIGAVVGGLIAREGEKEFYRRKERHGREEGASAHGRSKSR